MKKTLAGLFLFALLIGVFFSACKIQLTEAQNTTIYINSDGSVSPSSAPISTVDSVTYTFTGNISSPAYNGIVVQRSNIVIDGAGYTVQGNQSGHGLSLNGMTNVTIENINIQNFYDGIYVSGSSGNTISWNNVTGSGWDGIIIYSSSNNNVVSGNNVTANTNIGIFLSTSSNNNVVSGNKVVANSEGIYLYSSSNNTVTENNVTANDDSGIWLDSSSKNTVSGNNATANYTGIYLYSSSSNNVVNGNTVVDNRAGIWLGGSSNNTLYHNNFINNTASTPDSMNTWDNGYPSGGNYWSDYQTSYPNAVENDSSGIWNTPYVIDANNVDNFPLMTLFVIPEFQPFLLLLLFMTATLLAVAIQRKKPFRTQET